MRQIHCGDRSQEHLEPFRIFERRTLLSFQQRERLADGQFGFRECGEEADHTKRKSRQRRLDGIERQAAEAHESMKREQTQLVHQGSAIFEIGNSDRANQFFDPALDLMAADHAIIVEGFPYMAMKPTSDMKRGGWRVEGGG